MNKVPVNILGRAYEIEVAPGDELLLYSLAEYVETKLVEAQRDTGIVDTQKLAILAALNIADEYFRLKNSRENVSTGLDKKTEDLIKIIDEAITV